MRPPTTADGLRLDVDSMAEGPQSGLVEGLPQCRMGMDGGGDVVEPAAQFDGKSEGGRQLRDTLSHGLNAKDLVRVRVRHDAHEAAAFLKRHGTPVGGERKLG